MDQVSQPCSNPLSKKNNDSVIQTIKLNLESTSKITSIFVLIAALVNFIAVWIEIGNPVALVLNVSHSILLKVLSLFLWFFYSFGWFIPIAVVLPPTSYVLQRIMNFEQYVEAHLSDNCDIDMLMHWYNELFDANAILQKAFGPLVTLTIVLGAVFQIVLIMVCIFLSLLCVLFSFFLFRNCLLLIWMLLDLSHGLCGQRQMQCMSFLLHQL